MFTGIVDHCGIIAQIDRMSDACRLTIDSQFRDLVLGESIAVSGVCLTVTSFNAAGQWTCDVSPETLRVTSLRLWQVGQAVNLERALRLGDRFGGHYVMGHVDCCCKLQDKSAVGEYWEYRLTGFSPQERGLLVPKGSVAINGVSLTLNQVNNDFFSVMLVPHTVERTNLGALIIADVVNIEFDTIVRTVVNYVKEVKI